MKRSGAAMARKEGVKMNCSLIIRIGLKHDEMGRQTEIEKSEIDCHILVNGHKLPAKWEMIGREAVAIQAPVLSPLEKLKAKAVKWVQMTLFP